MIPVFLLLVVFALSGYGNSSSAGVSGLWERELLNAVGPGPLVVLEIREHGSYVTHASGWLAR